MIGENVRKAIVSFPVRLLGVLNDWGAAIVLFVVVVALTVLIWNYAQDAVKFLAANDTSIAITAVALFALFGLVLAITFFWVFRGIDADKAKVNAIISYCHAFIMFSLLASILPFIALPLIPGLYNFMVKSPIGIVAGCSVPVNDDPKSVPIELRCGADSDQWVVNIGGTTSRATTPGDNAADPTKPKNAAEAGPTKPKNAAEAGPIPSPRTQQKQTLPSPRTQQKQALPSPRTQQKQALPSPRTQQKQTLPSPRTQQKQALPSPTTSEAA